MTLERYIKKVNTAIFISGNGSNMERIINESLNGVLLNIINIKTVFSDNKDANGLKIAESYNIHNFYSKQYYKNRKKGEENIVSVLKNKNIDFVILAGYMRILSPYFIDKYRNKIINIHPADTVFYKGTKGYLWAYENKLSSSKITVHLVNEELDSGRILSKEEFFIPKGASIRDIEKIGLNIEHELYSKIIRNYVLKELK